MDIFAFVTIVWIGCLFCCSLTAMPWYIRYPNLDVTLVFLEPIMLTLILNVACLTDLLIIQFPLQVCQKTCTRKPLQAASLPTSPMPVEIRSPPDVTDAFEGPVTARRHRCI